MHTASIYAFVDELQKISHEKQARTRLTKEWRQLQAAGDTAGADQIAKAQGDLGLKQRFLKNISGGGQEAAVDLMMGRAASPNESGYVAKKLYKPDSFVSRGAQTSELLKQKQEYTDAARALSPEAKQMVPAMYGHQEIRGPQGQLRHVSEHEYVPGLKSIKSVADPMQPVKSVEKAVTGPMKAKGMPMGDVGFEAAGHLWGNTGNIMQSPTGPKVLDFIPQGKGRAVEMDEAGMGVISSYRNPYSKFSDKNVQDLRREVYRPGSVPVSTSMREAISTPKAKGFVEGLPHSTNLITPKSTKPIASTVTKALPKVTASIPTTQRIITGPLSKTLSSIVPKLHK